MFRITFGKGFHLVFKNGITLSTQFGYGNCCDNYNIPNPKAEKNVECKDCEIAIWTEGGNWITKKCLDDIGIENDDIVLGRVDMETWLKILDWCRNYKEG